jgi:hypothetical protein
MLTERSPAVSVEEVESGSEKRARNDVGGSSCGDFCVRTGTSFKRWITPGRPPQARRSCRIGPQKDPLEGAPYNVMGRSCR